MDFTIQRIFWRLPFFEWSYFRQTFMLENGSFDPPQQLRMYIRHVVARQLYQPIHTTNKTFVGNRFFVYPHCTQCRVLTLTFFTISKAAFRNNYFKNFRAQCFSSAIVYSIFFFGSKNASFVHFWYGSRFYERKVHILHICRGKNKSAKSRGYKAY